MSLSEVCNKLNDYMCERDAKVSLFFCICSVRLTVRTAGFHPANRGSIPLPSTNKMLLSSKFGVGHQVFNLGDAGSSPVGSTNRPIDKWLSHQLFTLKSRVRIPLG